MKNILKLGLMACLATAFVFAGCKKDDNNNYTVTLSANNAEWGVVAGGGEFADGTEIQIMATANSGYHFEKWSDDDTNNPRTITVNKNIALIAIFAEGNGGSNNSGNSETVTGDILPKKVTKIVKTKEIYKGSKSVRTYLFDSEGKITKYSKDDNSGYTFEYSVNSIVRTFFDGNNRGETSTFKIENGRIVSIDQGGGKVKEYGYSPDGYLISIGNEKYTYESGLLTKDTYSESNNNTEYYWEAKYTYGSNHNNLNVDLTLLFVEFDDEGVFSGLYGNRIKLLPSLIEESDYQTENGVKGDVEYQKREFTYEYSSEYITKIIEKETNEDGTKVLYNNTYEIFY
ncbi:MAG: hypothetical protein J6Y24_03610 [Bacteroidales bacterium]|nr:hypothetical protein [Bacteroidales bacterium]